MKHKVEHRFFYGQSWLSASFLIQLLLVCSFFCSTDGGGAPPPEGEREGEEGEYRLVFSDLSIRPQGVEPQSYFRFEPGLRLNIAFFRRVNTSIHTFCPQPKAENFGKIKLEEIATDAIEVITLAESLDEPTATFSFQLDLSRYSSNGLAYGLFFDSNQNNSLDAQDIIYSGEKRTVDDLPDTRFEKIAVRCFSSASHLPAVLEETENFYISAGISDSSYVANNIHFAFLWSRGEHVGYNIEDKNKNGTINQADANDMCRESLQMGRANGSLPAFINGITEAFLYSGVDESYNMVFPRGYSWDSREGTYSYTTSSGISHGITYSRYPIADNAVLYGTVKDNDTGLPYRIADKWGGDGGFVDGRVPLLRSIAAALGITGDMPRAWTGALSGSIGGLTHDCGYTLVSGNSMVIFRDNNGVEIGTGIPFPWAADSFFPSGAPHRGDTPLFPSRRTGTTVDLNTVMPITSSSLDVDSNCSTPHHFLCITYNAVN